MKVTVYSAIKHETTSKVLPEVFSVVDANPRAVALAMRVYRANARQATAKTKTRGEVTMTGKKVYKQKGTGGARHGSRRAPIFVGGGVTFGPHGNQNWSLTLPRRQRVRALQQAFGLRSVETSMMADLELAKGKTNTFAKAFDRIDAKARSIVMVIAPEERDLAVGMRNLAKVKICFAGQLNSYDVIKADRVVLTQQAVDLLTARFTSAKKAAQKEEPETLLAPAEKKPKAAVKQVAKAPAKKPAAKKSTSKKAKTE